MNLRIRLDEKAPFIVLVGLIFFASVFLAYAEDQRISAEAETRYALAQAEFERELFASSARSEQIRQLVGKSAPLGIEIFELRDSKLALLASNNHAIDHAGSGQLPVVERELSIGSRTLVVRYNAHMPLLLSGLAYWPVFILIGGFTLAVLVFFAFHMLWRSHQAARMASIEQRHALAQNQDRMRSIFDNAGDGICGLNADGGIVFANPAAAQILGAEASRLFEQRFVDFIENDESDTFTLDGNTKSKTEAPLLTSDGRRLFADVTITPMRNHSGSQSGTVVIFRDVTERIETERELRAANSELEEFAYRTSHDLRSPLVSAIGLLKIVRSSVEAGDLAIAINGISKTVESLSSLEQLVRDILTLTRARATQEEIETIDLDELVQSLLVKLDHLAGYDRIRVHCDATLGAISSMPSRVELIIGNLLSNAVKYHDPAKSEPQIWVSTYTDRNRKFITIEDNGIGIPHDQREHLFAMFKRFHPRVSFGSGLGLYMVKKSAEIVGAKVRYEPSRRGTRFTVSFPCATCSGEIAAQTGLAA